MSWEGAQMSDFLPVCQVYTVGFLLSLVALVFAFTLENSLWYCMEVLWEQIMFWVEHMRRIWQRFLFVASYELIAVQISDFTIALGLLLNYQTKKKKTL